jgi:hypothetical protein
VRCRAAGIETGANIILSTRSSGEVKELAELVLSLGAERFIPTYVFVWSSRWPAYEQIRPEPEDLAELPPKGLDVDWGYRDFWAGPRAFAEGALTRAAMQREEEAARPQSQGRKHSLFVWVAPNLDLLLREMPPWHKTVSTQLLANLRNDSPAQIYEALRTLEWPPDPPSDAELARRYGDTESRELYMRLPSLRQKWLEAWQAESDIPWLPFD